MKILIYIFIATVTLYGNIFTAKSYKANFQQIITNPSGKKIKYQGKIFLQSNGNILWNYEKPIIKNVYISTYQIIIDEPELEQAIIKKVKKDFNLIYILKQSKQISKNIYKNTINDIEYTIQLDNKNLTTISYQDNIENKIVIYFTNGKLNKKFNKNLFKFKLPKSYDIIRK